MILRFEDASYRYENTTGWALDGVTLTVSPGERVLIVGASGSGKSTLCRASVGLVPQFHGGDLLGHIFVDGMDTRQHPVNRLFGHIGLAFQNADAQLFNRTVEAELAYGLESLGLDPCEIERRLSWVSGLMGLRSLLGRSPHTLSGGQKQRVVIGAVLSLRPRILLLDEPFTHLDPEGAESLRFILQSIHEDGIAVVVVEHRLHEIADAMDRLVILHHGRIVADGPPRQVLGQDVSPYGLNLPPLVRLFREWGRAEIIPLSVKEASDVFQSSSEVSWIDSFMDEFGYRPTAQTSDDESQGRERDPLVTMENVSFSYDGQETLKHVTLKLGQRECVALVGRNGSGKTTLVKHLNGLLKPSRGQVEVLGRNTRATAVSELARRVGFAWQNPNDQLFKATVRDEVITGPRVLKVYDAGWCNELFERFGLEALLDRSPFRLSEGQKKRVAFATALAARPDLVVLDEPTAGQDEPFRRELGALMAELRGEGRTVVLVTHDLEFASEHAMRWVALADGEVVADASPEIVMADSKAMAAAGLRPTQRFQLLQILAESRKRDNREASGS
jgi:energy-coupling factor transporter ATP-binding protein EcfA2